ncbi:hypothetical protein OK016_16470 [Vibrio chagasii]|nr:hypothetical protein [Vibrio chagasii]
MSMQHIGGCVVIGFMIPLKGNKGEHSPPKHLEHALQFHTQLSLRPANSHLQTQVSHWKVSQFQPYGHATSWYQVWVYWLVSRWYLPSYSAGAL